MAQRIAIDCDFHGARDETVPGTPLDVAIRVDGGAFRFFTVDLCEQCQKPLAELFAEVAEMGREFAGDPAEAIKPPKRGGGRPPLPAECPVCGSSHVSRGAMRSHLRKAHGQTVADATGEAVDAALICPECGDKFNKPQGIAAHRRLKHPEAFASSQAEAHADG